VLLADEMSRPRTREVSEVNQITAIGKFVSSGCIRLTNEDVTDLYSTWRSHLWATDSIVLDDAWR
jgi:hypothetical protein